MFKSIIVPVDLGHLDKLDKAMSVTGTLAKQFGAEVTLVGVTASVPTSVAHNPEEFAEKLQAYGDAQAKALRIGIKTRAMTTGDPVRDLDAVLEKAAHEIGADLAIMATHMPGIYEHVFSSNAGYLATHGDISVFVVRG